MDWHDQGYMGAGNFLAHMFWLSFPLLQTQAKQPQHNFLLYPKTSDPSQKIK